MTLKTKNTPYLLGFLILLYIGFAMANGFDWSFAKSMEISNNGIKLDHPVLSIAVYILALFLTYLLPSEWKHRLIYLRWRNPLPGCRIFTDLLHKDQRISRETLVSEHGELPSDADKQNNLWYKIYKSKQTDTVVLNSHGRWLLFRDLFAISIILFLPSTIFTFWSTGLIKGFVFIFLYIVLLIINWVCARNTGERFACNVLAR